MMTETPDVNEDAANALLQLQEATTIFHQETQTKLQEIRSFFQKALNFLLLKETRHCFEMLSQIMDTICTQTEALNLTCESNQIFWKEVNESFLYCLSVRQDGMTEDDWIGLRDSVIAWGDVLEWYGLVDYELGFWENKILDLIHLRIHELKGEEARLSGRQEICD